MIEIIKCSRCNIEILSKEFSGCDDCSDEFEETDGTHLCGDCCLVYSNLSFMLYEGFLDNIIHITDAGKIYYQPERSKRENNEK